MGACVLKKNIEVYVIDTTGDEKSYTSILIMN